MKEMMNNAKVLKIVGIVVSVVGATASVVASMVSEQQQTQKIDDAVAKRVAEFMASAETMSDVD